MFQVFLFFWRILAVACNKINFVGCQSQHIWANPHKCIISNIIKQAQNWPPRKPRMVTYLEYWGLPQYFNSHLQPIHNSQLHSLQTQFSMESVDLVCTAKNTCRFAVIPHMGEPPINWPTVNLVYITQKCRDKLIPFLKTRNSSTPCKLFRKRSSPESFKWTPSDNKNCLVFFSNQGILCPTPLQYRLCNPTIHFQPESLHSCIIPGIPLFCSQKHLTPNQNWLSKELFN